MVATWIVVGVSLAYLALLFGIAWWGDRRAEQGRSLIDRPLIYALSLAVYATSWTYYGSVGRAASTGVGFLPIYLGPTVMAGLWWYLMRRILRVCKQQRITSLADFISTRYGKSTALGVVVTVIAVVGLVPYIALQLKAVSNTFVILTGGHDRGSPPPLEDTGLYVALLLAAFTIVFGTRHLDASERHEGMVAAIAFESVVKLLAFLIVGIFVTWGLFGGFGDLVRRAAARPDIADLFTLAPETSYGSWFWLTILSMLAILLLPRQFQVAVVENVDERHLDRAVWQFPLYLLIINVFVLPVTLAGLLRFPAGDVNADTFVLALPMNADQHTIALIAFLGGLSAATGMVIVETIALSTMVSNSLVLPALLRWRPALIRGGDLRTPVLAIRRITMVAVMLLGYAYFRVAGEAAALVSIGLVSFAAVAQFAPALLGGILWKRGSRDGAIVGLAAGFTMWTYTLLLPALARSGWLPMSFVSDGPAGQRWLRPEHLLGLEDMDAISHAMFWSMLVNVGGYVAVSLAGSRSAFEHGQAVLFVDALRTRRGPADVRLWRGTASLDALRGLLTRFVGGAGADNALREHARVRGLPPGQDPPADAELVHDVETILAGSVGAASARVLVASVVEEEPLGPDEIMEILDEASAVRAHSRELERKSRELEQATAELRSANLRLQELDHLKDDFISTVTHELRTPLTSIRAFSEILLDNPELDAGKRADYLRIVAEETERLTRLINQVLDLSKLESGVAEWHVERVHLAVVVEDSVAATRRLFEARNARVENRVPAGLPPVWGDRDRVVQVLLNLLSNAAKFAPTEHGLVTVSAAVLDGAVRVDVADNGPGVAEHEWDVVFDKFRRGGQTLAERPAGTGLGLPISREIINHLGGRIWVDRNSRGGATFSFTLPLEAP